ncbi:MAG: thioesterase family protein [Candidatus Omnitrophica bacterium]|jgi:acyl-CoA thioester hydrolase|nr:acyl-CoA thioesterase [Candidatus Omnitrophota bacterium]MDD5079343.1 thioesterase family protein [Candidatus Omnitrophota bacterium]
MKVKIYYHHTDAGGVVYHASYLQFLEESRTDLLARAGIDMKQLIAQGRFFAVIRQELDFSSPVFYGDTLDINARITEISAARITFEHQMINQNGRAVACAKTTLVHINSGFKPIVIPEAMRHILDEYKGKDRLC